MKKGQTKPARGSTIPEGYDTFFRELKARIRGAQLQAVLAVNHELILLYWRIGCDILERQDRLGWGAKVIDRLASELLHEFPEMKGFSRTNLIYMRAFASAWPDHSFVQQVVGQIPWGHNLRILDLVKTLPEREWYIRQTIENGWSRNVLVHQIESGLYRRQGKAQTNFTRTLPAPQSELAQQVLKDPYNFDFLTLSQHAREKELESGLLDHLQKFLLELGVGFAFVGRQYRIEVDGEDFKIDLLFYHIKLRCFVVIDLKMGSFKPEYAGKMSFYLSAVDDLLRQPDHQRSIGLILCKSKKAIIAEYTLRDSSKPIGVAEYRVTETLPDDLRGILPTIEELEQGLAGSDRDPGYSPAYREAYPDAYPSLDDPPDE
ncbi:MAG TPA: PDDEXK nuclease domain-containing protein [Bryobacteraceae bacterium]|nr:PDDEXK nuclease domain-containing protein [Bryobacteraceae bacterium]